MDPLAPVIAALHAEGRLRVWSLVITLFGDSILHRGGAVTSAQVQTVLGRLGVDAGAVRTALSRLARDGWLDRREGRYRLSDKGTAEFATALGRVYAPPMQGGNLWTMAVAESAPVPEAFQIAPMTWLWPGARGQVGLSLTGQDLSASSDMRQALLTPEHRAALGSLAADLAAVSTPPDDPLTAIAARTALIHRWRRLVLRFADLPPDLLPSDAPLAAPRAAMAEAYHPLCAPSERWLDTEGFPTAPDAAQTLARRFQTPE